MDPLIPAAEMERMMKVQEVILRAVAGKLKWWEAAEIIGVTDRTMRRWRQRYQELGYDGLYDRRKRQPSTKRMPLETVERVLALYRDKYFDCNVRHFHEKLHEVEGLRVSYTWVKLTLQGAGMVEKRRRRGSHRRRRPRRSLPGMLLHIDGSTHAWFQDGRYYDLIVILDDATSEIYYAQLVEQESTRTVMAAVREVVERRGVFCALYSDRAGHGREAHLDSLAALAAGLIDDLGARPPLRPGPEPQPVRRRRTCCGHPTATWIG